MVPTPEQGPRSQPLNWDRGPNYDFITNLILLMNDVLRNERCWLLTETTYKLKPESTKQEN